VQQSDMQYSIVLLEMKLLLPVPESRNCCYRYQRAETVATGTREQKLLLPVPESRNCCYRYQRAEGTRGSVVVEALCYKLEGPGFNSR
jgi:hypothetical protein